MKEDQRQAVDPLASQRADLLREVSGARTDLNHVIVELIRSGASTATVDAQISKLAALQLSIGTADRSTLAALSAEVASAVAQSRATADQAQQAADMATGSGPALTQAAASSRTAVASAMDSLQHIPLTFTSAEDERAYRQREDERRAYIGAQQAKHTPVGDLNASGAAIGQMVDANAHGAQGPEFDQKWSELVRTTEKLRAEAKASGLSTEEFDNRLRDDLRRIMKSKGYTDAQIDAQFKANADPLEAAKAFVKDGADIDVLKQAEERKAPKTGQIASAMTPQAQADAKDLIASLKATGMVMSDVAKGTDPHHGTGIAAIDTVHRGV